MSQQGHVIVQDERFAGNTMSSAGWQMLMPVLLGFTVPGVAVVLFAPHLLSNPMLIFGFYLTTLFVVSAVIFIRSVFNPGSVVEAVFDARSKSANFVRLGTFATTNFNVDFRDIAEVYLETQYDDDGYKSYMPMVVLKNGEEIQLPEGTTHSQIQGIKTLVGC